MANFHHGSYGMNYEDEDDIVYESFEEEEEDSYTLCKQYNKGIKHFDGEISSCYQLEQVLLIIHALHNDFDISTIKMIDLSEYHTIEKLDWIKLIEIMKDEDKIFSHVKTLIQELNSHTDNIWEHHQNLCEIMHNAFEKYNMEDLHNWGQIKKFIREHKQLITEPTFQQILN